MKKKTKLFIAAKVIALAIAVFAMKDAYIERGYFAFGGEWVIPFLPELAILMKAAFTIEEAA